MAGEWWGAGGAEVVRGRMGREGGLGIILPLEWKIALAHGAPGGPMSEYALLAPLAAPGTPSAPAGGPGPPAPGTGSGRGLIASPLTPGTCYRAVMSRPNPYCKALAIPVPSLERARESPDANSYSLLIVVLLERGGPVTLEEAALRFEQAGVAPAPEALRSLKRCRPGRSPIYRHGDLYELDPHDDEAGLWAFRLGLCPAKTLAPPGPRVVRGPLPDPDAPLTVAALDEAWRGGLDSSWSAQRLAICVLDAHSGVMKALDVRAFVASRTRWSLLSAGSARYWRQGAPVWAHEDGTWRLDAAHAAVRSARAAVRARLEVVRRHANRLPDPAVAEAAQRERAREHGANAARLAGMSRVLLHAFPAARPQALTLLDVRRRILTTLLGDELANAATLLAGYDLIAAVQVRELLRTLGFDPGERRLGELGPPQKTMTIDQRGRALKLSMDLLVQGSCGISRPFGPIGALGNYLRRGEQAKLRRRLEADAKALHALYQYGRLHGCVRVRWGFLDEMIRVPWVHPDEPGLHQLMTRAADLGVPLEVVANRAPGWESPWSRGELAHVVTGEPAWQLALVDVRGLEIDRDDVQLARIPGEGQAG
jgi:hypothetical protein